MSATDEPGQLAPRKSGLSRFDEAFLPPEPAKPAAPAEVSFRDRALAAGDNPLEHIDRLLHRTSSRLWLGVAAFAGFVIAGLVWATIAERTVTVASQAVLIPETGLFTAGELAQGAVTDVAVQEGAAVKAGQRLATVATAQGAVEVPSPVDGTVVAVQVRPGELHSAGEAMFVLTPPDAGLTAVALLAPGPLSSIQVGQAAAIQVNGVAADRYGRIRGKVASIGTVPATRSRLRQLTGDAGLAGSIAQQGPVYEVVVHLQPSDTPSGLRWTQGAGPASPIPVGALGVASVVVDHQSLLVKAFR